MTALSFAARDNGSKIDGLYWREKVLRISSGGRLVMMSPHRIREIFVLRVPVLAGNVHYIGSDE